MKPKKSLGMPRVARAKLGQNFLRDLKILKKIADFARIEKGDTVIEIGPGEGTLTKLLLERATRVIAVEKDAGLVELLKNKFKLEIENFKLKILLGDILNIENLLKTPTPQGRGADQSIGLENYILVGNIPYYITGEIFRKFLESDNPPKSISFVVQKEVADRIIAKDGKESVLSISIKAFGTPEYGGIIKAGSFVPAPKVDSAILSVRNIRRFDLRERFFEIVKKGFSHKRKLLKSNLRVEGALLHKCGIAEKARAENLLVEDWICLTRNLV